MSTYQILTKDDQIHAHFVSFLFHYYCTTQFRNSVLTLSSIKLSRTTFEVVNMST